MKYVLGVQILKEFVGFRAKTYSYLKGNNMMKINKVECTKKCVIKRKHKIQDFKNCLEAARVVYKINHLEKYRIDVDNLKKD